MTRDPSRPLDEVFGGFGRGRCGYALEEDGSASCGEAAVYRFSMDDWPDWRVGNTCAAHALVVRRWSGVTYMRSLTAVPQ